MRKEADKLFRIFKDKEIYLVGGYVRDLLLGIENDDLDFATDLLPDEIIEVLKINNLKHWDIGKSFGTISTKIDGLKIEITTYRIDEAYTKNNRHPRVKFGKTLKDDLIRRDFTINTLAMDGQGNIIDLFNGINDLKKGIIKTPLNSNKTFSDDPLRMIRAVRFVSKLGFNIEEDTLKGITENVDSILSLAVERIKIEMDKLLLGDYVEKALNLLIDTRIINYYLPELTTLLNVAQDERYHHKDIWKHTKLVVKNSPKDIIIKWSALLHDIAKPYTKVTNLQGIHFYSHDELGANLAEYILRRLKFSNKEIKQITMLILNHMRPNLYMPEWADKAIRKLKNDVGDLIDKLLALSRADITSQRPERINNALNRLDDLELRLSKAEITKKFEYPITGNDIMKALEIEQGKMVGYLKEALKNAIENNLLPKNNEDKSIYFEYLENILNEMSL